MGAKLKGSLSSGLATFNNRLIGRGWRRVFALAVVPLATGIALLVGFDSDIVKEIGTGFVGGSILGLVFAIAQFTLDQQTADRQEHSDLRLTLASTPELSGIDLTGRDLSRSYMRRKDMRRARLDDACLVEANLNECRLGEATMRGARLAEANLRGADLRGAVLDEADLSGAHLNGARIAGASLVGVNLTGATMSGVVPQKDDETQDELVGNVGPTNLSRAVLDYARLDGADLRACFASFVSAYRVEAPGVVLAETDLSCADMRAANLHRADLRRVDLSGADLTGAELSGADLREARLVGACLAGANLSGARIDGADLRAADVRGAQLTNVDDSTADFTDSLRSPEAVPPDAVINPLLLTGDPHGGSGDPRDAPAPRRLVILPADGGLRGQAEAIAAVLVRRRAALSAANARLATVDPLDGIPHFGEARDHGLPQDVRIARHWPLRRAAVAVLRTDGLELQVGVAGQRPFWRSLRHRMRGPHSFRAGPWSGIAHASPAAGANAIQLALGGERLFADPGDLAAVGAWLDGDDVERDATRAAEHAARNPLALVVRAWRRESSDIAQMELAIDEARIAWASTRSPLLRAIAAARIGWAQGQVFHRSSATDLSLARARSAIDWAVERLDRVIDERPESPELLVVKLKGFLARGLAYSAFEEYEELTRGIRMHHASIEFSRCHGLMVSPIAVNSLGYSLMVRAGRFTRGGGHDDYVTAAKHFRWILETYADADAAGHLADVSIADLVDAVRARHEALVRAAALSTAEQRSHGRAVRLALVNLGNLCRLYRRYDDALTCYDAAIDNDPDYREAYTERAWIHLDRGDLVRADADVEAMLTRHGGTPGQIAKNLANYAEAQGRAGLWPNQRPWLVEALKRDSSDERVHQLLTVWEQQAGMPAKSPEDDTHDDPDPSDDKAGTPSSVWPAPRLRPDTYPGPAPDYPHLLLGDRVFPMDVRCARDVLRLTLPDGTSVDDELHRLGAAPLAERVPAIGYGANRSPNSLALKFAHHGNNHRVGSDVVPVLTGSLADVDTVAAGISSQGFIYADIIDSPGTRVEVTVALLDLEQLAAIHDSEDVGRMYDCGWLRGFSIAGTEGTLSAMGYLGRRPTFRVPEGIEGEDAGQPLAFSRIGAERRQFPSLGQPEMMARVIEVTDVAEDLAKLLGCEPSASPRTLAHDLVRLLNGQWWYFHNTGDHPMHAAVEARQLVSKAMAAHAEKRPAGSPLTAQVLSTDKAYMPGTAFRLGHQVELP